MQLVTVGSRYQIVIPREVRRKTIGIIPGAKVAVSADNKGNVSVKPAEKNWVERTRGIAKIAWKGIDTTKYLEDLRNEWDRKV